MTTETSTIWTPEDATNCRKLLPALVLDNGKRWGDGGLQQWQRDAYASTLGLPEAPSKRRRQVWIEGPTGCGKDQLLAAAVLACLKFAPEGFEIVAYSSDIDRCRDLVKTVRGFITRTDACAEERGSPKWLGVGIEILRDEIRYLAPDASGAMQTSTSAHIEALDGYSASGSRADLYLLNEVQSWPDPHGARVWEESLARYDKLDHGRFVVFSNAPFSPVGDFRRDERDKAAAAGADSPWHFQGVTLEQCPWFDAERLERKRQSLPPHVFRRLYLCLPTDGRGELIEPAVFDAAVDDRLCPRDAPEPGVQYVHGVDVGVSRDHAVHLVLHRDAKDHRIYLDRVRVWLPSSGRQIDLDVVERHVTEEMQRFRGQLFADPYQAVQMCQRLERAGFKVTQVGFTTDNLTKMCEAVRGAFNDRRIVLFPDAGHVRVSDRVSTSLRRQVLEAEVVETEKGTRIKSPRNKAGHGDELSALALALFGLNVLGIQSVPVCVGSGQSSPRPDLGRGGYDRFGCGGVFRPNFGRYSGPRELTRRRIAPR